MLAEDEIKRLGQTIAATIASPLIGSIEDYTWEAIFHHVKNIPLSDPALGRSKLLYDAVDTITSTGWSLKSLQLKKLTSVNTFSFVIQRADIIKKATQLGFPSLTEKSSPDELGLAIIKHWNDKVTSSQTAQGVINSYESILLKTIGGYEYIYCEFPLNIFDPSNFSWAWTINKETGESGAGLQGSIEGKIELVWYKNQKQLFRTRTISPQVIYIKVERTRLTLDRYVETILSALQDQLSTEPLDCELEE
jgi:hypothetical protein